MDTHCRCLETSRNCKRTKITIVAMWCCTVDNYSRLDINEDDEDGDHGGIDKDVRKCVDDNFNFDSSKIDQLENHLTNGSKACYPVALSPISKNLSLDLLPKDILVKIASNLNIRDLMSLEKTCKPLKDFVLHYWRIFCERTSISNDPTPLCVGWRLNPFSLYSYDNALMCCQDPVKKWRLSAMRSLLVGRFCCVICGQHLKDRMSVDGIYFNHDVLLCFPDCYHIFTVNINDPVLEICQKYGLGQNDLILVNSTYPVLLVNEFIQKLRQMGINDKELLAEIRPYLGFSKDALQRYYDYVEKIRTLSSLM